MTETQCPICGERKARIAQHWAMGECGYPHLDADHRDIVDGLVLAGATVAGNGSNRHLTIGTTSESLAEWTADKLDWLCHSVRPDNQDETRDDVYRIRTPAHPALNRYERWMHVGESGGRAPPDEFGLSPRAGRVWWAFAGGLEWGGAYDSQRQGGFSAAADAKQDWIIRVLEGAGFDVASMDRRIRLRPTETSRWLDWIGDDVPGVEHKWADSLIDYRTIQRDPETEGEFRAEFCTVALEVARERTDSRLTADLFEERVDEIPAALVADTLGGGSWEGALSVAGVDIDATSEEHGDKPRRGRVFDEEDVSEAIRDAADAMGEPLGIDEYREWRADSQPSAPSEGTIKNWCRWSEATQAAGVAPKRAKGHTTEDLIDAICWVREQLGHWPTSTEYREYRKPQHPSQQWLSSSESAEIDGFPSARERAQAKWGHNNELSERLVAAGVPDKRARIVAAVISTDDTYEEIASRFDVKESAVGAHVYHYRRQRDEDDEIRESTPPIDRRSGTWPE